MSKKKDMKPIRPNYRCLMISEQKGKGNKWLFCKVLMIYILNALNTIKILKMYLTGQEYLKDDFSIQGVLNSLVFNFPFKVMFKFICQPIETMNTY